MKPIDVGDSLPSLTLKNEKGEDVDVSTLTAEKGVILFLVPKADTRKLFVLFYKRSTHSGQLDALRRRAASATRIPTLPRSGMTCTA